MLDFLNAHMEEVGAMILFGIGFSLLLLNRNLIKKIMGLNIMDTAVYLFLTIEINGLNDPGAYTNPIPDGLVLTGIVVSVSVSALLLSLTIRLYARYHTLDLDDIIMQLHKEEGL